MLSMKRSVVNKNSEKTESTINYFELVETLNKNKKPFVRLDNKHINKSEFKNDTVLYFGETGEKKNNFNFL
jgi:hypothetical protein|tara:strand:- start:27 stop:239 length:213 start_codon:yes stop_codon:yes gene_type:complete